MLPYRALVRVFIMDLVLLAGMHRFLICFTKTGAGEGENRFNAAEILFLIAGVAWRTGVAAVTGVFPGTRWGCCRRRI